MESLILQHIMVSWLLELRNLPLTSERSSGTYFIFRQDLDFGRNQLGLIPGDTKLDDDYSNHLIVGSDIRR